MKTLLVTALAGIMAAVPALAEVRVLLIDDAGTVVEEFTADNAEPPVHVVWEKDGAGGAGGGYVFDSWDLDNSGMLSSGELAVAPAVTFDAGGGSGILTQGMVGASGDRIFMTRDFDRDGAIDRGEFEAGSWKVLSR